MWVGVLLLFLLSLAYEDDFFLDPSVTSCNKDLLSACTSTIVRTPKTSKRQPTLDREQCLRHGEMFDAAIPNTLVGDITDRTERRY